MISIDLPDGTFGGQSPVFCEDRNNRIKSLYPQFVGVLANSQNLSTVDVVRNLLDGEKLDLLFIDGDHKYDGVKSDFELYRDFVKPGGVILFHDIEDTDYHRFWNVEVSRLWKELQGEKYEFTIHSHWCGLGALVV
jgi:hypothetical protein